jgi:hypothetical protein
MEPSTDRNKSICVPFESEAHYAKCVADPDLFRRHLLAVSKRHPELFPDAVSEGFACHDRYRSSKLALVVRRIKLTSTGEVFLVRPSFLMPYLIGRTDEIERALYLRQWAVPFDALAYVFGRNAMFWYRAWCALGRPSIVGSTIKDASRLPAHVIVDEKHTSIQGEKVYIPTTVAGGCILGASVVASASAKDLTAGYGEFAEEARDRSPEYAPATVCADGWEATQAAWRAAFPSVAIILCFLHSVIKMRDCCRKNGRVRDAVLDRAWAAYEAATRAQFSQRLRRLREWAEAQLPEGLLRQTVLKACAKRARFAVAYQFPGSARTSNAVDRLMNYQDRLLYAMRYFHGTRASARLSVRAMALGWNFHPYGARTRRADENRRSPFQDVNAFQYHDNWLHNLLIASSMGGRRH